jgi:hypothetical protein
MTRKQAHRLLLSLLKDDDLINSVEIMFDSLSDLAKLTAEEREALSL